MAQLKTTNVHGDLHVSGDITQEGNKVYHEGNKPTKADVGLSGIPNTNASTANFLRGDGTWVTPPNTNTTYAEITTAEIDAGTASTLRTITGRRMKHALDKKSDTGHGHVIGDVTGLQTAIDSKANTATQVIAGTGLSGGGTLAANRTLAVTYGTAAGTAAQGNDSRLSNSREWTAAVVTQAEAEAGTVTTARKWTAQRVRQAVLAWWSGTGNQTKLDGIATGATKNATDAQLRARSSHTGAQAISTVTGLQAALDSKEPADSNIVKTGKVQTLSGKTITSLKETHIAITSNAINLSLGNSFSKTVTGATTFTVSNVPPSGTAFGFLLHLTNGGSASVVWWSGVKWSAGQAPVLTPSGRDILGFVTYDGGVTWSGTFISKDSK